MTNRRNQIEIENVHNLIHHVEIESLFVFFQNFNRTVLGPNGKYKTDPFPLAPETLSPSTPSLHMNLSLVRLK